MIEYVAKQYKRRAFFQDFLIQQDGNERLSKKLHVSTRAQKNVIYLIGWLPKVSVMHDYIGLKVLQEV